MPKSNYHQFMKLGPFEIFPEQDTPELSDSYALFWYLPFTGAHYFYMHERNKGLFRLAVLFVWIVFPLIGLLFKRFWFKSWLYSGPLLIILWLYDLLVLRKTFEMRWGKRSTYRV
jgi:hypothetical protein